MMCILMRMIVMLDAITMWVLNAPYAFAKKTPNFAQGLDFLSFQVAMGTVFDEESESEVEEC